MQLNLPPVPVHDLVVKEGDLVAGTHGRSFWILDDLSAIRQYTAEIAAKPVHLFQPRDAYRINWGGGGFGGGGGGQGGASRPGQNPPSGVVVYYHLKNANQPVKLEFLAADAASSAATRTTGSRCVRRRAGRVAKAVVLAAASVAARSVRATPWGSTSSCGTCATRMR